MSEITPMDSSTFLAVEQCLYRLKLCVRLSPDGTYKPEGAVKMSREVFCMWVQREMKQAGLIASRIAQGQRERKPV